MTTGSLCLTEILKSWKPCSSNSDASQTADSTSASGRGLAVLGQQARVERAGVDADPDRRAGVGRRAGDLLDLVVELADVARVDADRGAAGVDRREDVLRLEVDVRDHGDLRLVRDGRQRVGVVLRRDGHADDVAAGGGQLGDLLQRRVDVGGLRRAHRLDADGGVAADVDLADLDLAGLAPGCQDQGGRLRHAEADRDAHAVHHRTRQRRAPARRGRCARDHPRCPDTRQICTGLTMSA